MHLVLLQEQEAKNSTQHIIFPQGDAGGTDPSTHKLYVASHRSFAPGAFMKVAARLHQQQHN